MKIIPKEIPKIFEFRKWVSFKLVKLAQFICPENEAVKAFYLHQMHDQMIYGRSIVRIDPYEDLK